MKRLLSAQLGKIERAKLVVVVARERAAVAAQRYAVQSSTVRSMHAPTPQQRRRLMRLSAKS
jgi:hypothetical protein